MDVENNVCETLMQELQQHVTNRYVIKDEYSLTYFLQYLIQLLKCFRLVA